MRGRGKDFGCRGLAYANALQDQVNPRGIHRGSDQTQFAIGGFDLRAGAGGYVSYEGKAGRGAARAALVRNGQRARGGKRTQIVDTGVGGNDTACIAVERCRRDDARARALRHRARKRAAAYAQRYAASYSADNVKRCVGRATQDDCRL